MKNNIKKLNIIIVLALIMISTLISLRSCVSILNTSSYMSTDVSVWVNIARAMDQGKIIYSEIFDHKGPLLYVFYFFTYKIFNGKIGLLVLDYLCVLVDCIIIYGISKKITNSNSKSLLTVTVTMFFLSFLCLENPCSESISLPFILISLNEFIKFVMDYRKFGRKESLYTRNKLRRCFVAKAKSHFNMDYI